MSLKLHPSLLYSYDLMSANAQRRSEKCTARSLQQFPGAMLNVPNNLVNIYQVTVLKHIPMYCSTQISQSKDHALFFASISPCILHLEIT